MSRVFTTIDFMRHGEPVGGSRYRGQIDDPLSELGWQQMQDAVPDEIPWQKIVTSPLIRCQAFAEELAQSSGLPVAVDERLQEVGFGVWEGMTRNQLRADDPHILQRFFSDPVANRPQGAEALSDFKQRVSAAIDDVVNQSPGQHVLVIAHAGVIRAAMCYALGSPIEHMFRIKVSNASMTRLQFVPGSEASLLFHEG
ncbi:MAG: histidine phosphatase family protein [Gammaproteobacteria bacterium]|nr:MAG: histidine phosphatase family protein [Gammaproteobacteria bacterium]